MNRFLIFEAAHTKPYHNLQTQPKTVYVPPRYLTLTGSVFLKISEDQESVHSKHPAQQQIRPRFFEDLHFAHRPWRRALLKCVPGSLKEEKVTEERKRA